MKLVKPFLVAVTLFSTACANAPTTTSMPDGADVGLQDNRHLGTDSDSSSADVAILDQASMDWKLGADQATECIPGCAGKDCGDDGCGGSCGECPTGEQCDAMGLCTAVCQKLCLAVECGAPTGYPECDCGGCDDGNPCTSDLCQVGECLFEPMPAACDDDDPCTANDECIDGACTGEPLNCSDDNPCTIDICSNGGCTHMSQEGDCDDGDPCTSNDTCTAGKCAGDAVDCDDSNPCTVDTCEPSGDCLHDGDAAEGLPCDDGNPCTGDDVCLGEGCVGSLLPPEELAGLECLCSSNEDCSAVDDDDVCNGVLICSHEPPESPVGVCIIDEDSIPDCNDGVDCTDDTCHPTDGCQNVPDSSACVDGNLCTGDTCSPIEGCIHTPTDGAPCDDKNACTVGDVCEAGECGGGNAADCNDANPCTDDSCDPILGCQHATDDTNGCDDGDICNGLAVCSQGICVPGEALECNDNNPCTKDTCHPTLGCQAIPDDEASCEDGNVCTGADTCQAGLCVAGIPVECDDQNPCTADTCETGVGCTYVPTVGACSDGVPCTADVCDGGKCVSTPVPGHCLVDGQCHEEGELAGDGSCNVCIPSESPSSWTPIEDGEMCDEPSVCHQGFCCDPTPACDANECGPDGCGGSCGLCQPGQICLSGGCISGRMPVALGAGFSCAIDDGGDVWCWGHNGSGQLGTGNQLSSNVPAKTLAAANASYLAAGSSHVCALHEGGFVDCWGRNMQGQLGTGSTSPSLVFEPVTAVLPEDTIGLTAGTNHTCAWTSTGNLYCWGDNHRGQVGNGSKVDSALPEKVIDEGVVYAAAGSSHTCAVKVDGSVLCWGNNGAGQLGIGTNEDSLVPTPVDSLGDVIAVATGAQHTCTSHVDGSVYCWGSNTSGQLGVALAPTTNTPMLVDTLPIAPVHLGSAGHASCAVGSNGAVYCWGSAAYGQLGTGSSELGPEPQHVGTLQKQVLVVGGDLHFCGLGLDGDLKCWGWNADGQLGNGAGGDISQPVDIDLPEPAALVSGGQGHTCASTVGGALYCWGHNHRGQLGTGTEISTQFPTGPALNAGVKAVACGATHTCALTKNGQALCWGLNSAGQLGDGTQVDRLLPTAVKNSGTVVGLAAGATHSCAVLSNTMVECWGQDKDGQLGNGSADGEGVHPLPVKAYGLAGALQVACGSSFTCALTVAGNVYCWGDNAFGQLGSAWLADPTVPNQVSSLTGIAAIAAGDKHACALDSSGYILCWGANAGGQLGDGTFDGSATPKKVTLGEAAAVFTGGWHTCALSDDKAVHCWGHNSSGQVGDGTLVDKASPTLVEGLPPASFGAGGEGQTCIVGEAGELLCWGRNRYGELGVGGAWLETPGPVLGFP